MNSIDDFVALLRDELALSVTVDDIGLGFDAVPSWDSVHLLSVCTILERETGRSLALSEVLQAPSLEAVYRLATTS
ncbi:acyl carrier protein [Streptomyces sp. NPDC046831]|uniref:acyl carrier protein n=1 Tax=Streptomyces sp. NPDC046831 TaxID=3154805 RepID=UPI0034080AAD